MTTPRSLILHIGTHKTGTTSIQAFLREELGAPAFPVGLYFADNHIECLVAWARPQLCEFLTKLNVSWQEQAATDRLERELGSSAPTIIYSCEQLSLMREPAELQRVRAACGDRELNVVVYTRSPEGFLRSYAFSRALLGARPSSDPDSLDYVEADSWLVDYETRIALWQRYADSVTIVNYDEVCARDGSVIPSFAALLGLTPARDYRLNTTRELRERLAVELLRAGAATSS